MTTDVESNTSENQRIHNTNTQEEKERQAMGEIRNLNEIPGSLFYWNVAASVFQFVQAAVLFYLSSQADTKWFWYVFYPASFARHQNPFRWAEYAVSASLMRVMIAQLCGITDIHLLFTVFALCALTMLLGGIHESVNAKARADGFKQNWYPFVVSWIAHLASWMPIVNYFFVAVKRGDPPNFVWSIIFILFFLDGTFAALFSLQWCKVWKFKDYVFGEKGFIVLSFTAKALLAWINYGGGSR
mgnify:CR=1 FL=1